MFRPAPAGPRFAAADFPDERGNRDDGVSSGGYAFRSRELAGRRMKAAGIAPIGTEEDLKSFSPPSAYPQRNALVQVNSHLCEPRLTDYTLSPHSNIP